MTRKRRQRHAGGHGRKKRKRRASHRGRGGRGLIILIVLVIAGIAAYRFIQTRPPGVPVSVHRARHDRREINVYIARAEGLRPLKRSMKRGPLEDEIREAFTILKWADSGRIIPRGTRLLGVSVKGGTAYLDFSRQLRDGHPGGTSAEMQTIYAIVNTIALNFAQIGSVKILIEGKSEKTLAGHIDISAPLRPYRGIIIAS